MPTPEWRAKHGRERLSPEARARLAEKRRAKNTPEFLAAEAQRMREFRARRKSERASVVPAATPEETP